MSESPTLPPLETDRLLLRLGEPALAAAMAAFQQDNRAFLAPFEPIRSETFYMTEFWQARLEQDQREFTNGTAVRFILAAKTAPDTVIGVATLTNIARGPAQFGFLGYSLAETAQGHGYMFEALQTAIAYLFTEQNLHRIMANYMPHNVRSGKLLRRLGFVVDGYARDYLRIAGNWEDHILTSLTNPDWRVPD